MMQFESGPCLLFSTLVVGWPAGGLLSLGLLAVGGVLLWSSYRRVGLTATDRRVGLAATDRRSGLVAAALLKAMAILLLAGCLVEPLWAGLRPRPHANLFLILADGSQSMTVHDAGQATPPSKQLLDELERSRSWQVRLEQDFDVRRYVFHDRLALVEDYANLAFDGTTSRLASALRALTERHRSLPVAGILVFTDGNATDSNPADLDLPDLPPIYPVPVGSPPSQPDLAVAKLTVTETVFEDAPVSVQAEVRATGLAGQSVLARLVDEANEVVAEERLAVTGEEESLACRLRLRPKGPGLGFYRLVASVDRPQEQAEEAGPVIEATGANNHRPFAAGRGHGPYRILYVAGRPNWEYKFLRRAIEGEDQIQLVGLVRIARREPKFDWRGRTGETANPLFQGFDKLSADETTRYDQPVFIRLDAATRSELESGFPTTAEGLFRYHAVILDDVESEFFTHAQLGLLAEFVSKRGGGLLMLGGQESLDRGGYRTTPLAPVLPIYLDRPGPRPPAGRLHWELTREGWLQPWIRLRANEPAEADRIARMPDFRSVHHLENAKPGASVLAELRTESGERVPALVVQSYGRGRAAAITIGDLWRWGLSSLEGRDDLARAWRQTLRWLVADVPGRVELAAEPEAAADPARRITVRVRDERFEPCDAPSVQLTVTTPAGEKIEFSAEPSLTMPGAYEADFVPRLPGPYRVHARVRQSEDRTEAAGNDPGGQGPGHDPTEKLEAQTGWVWDPASDEFRSLGPNRQMLETLARQTGGAVVELDSLDGFVRGLEHARVPITEHWTWPLWHLPVVFLAAIGCLVGEWGLRRKRGLA